VMNLSHLGAWRIICRCEVYGLNRFGIGRGWSIDVLRDRIATWSRSRLSSRLGTRLISSLMHSSEEFAATRLELLSILLGFFGRLELFVAIMETRFSIRTGFSHELDSLIANDDHSRVIGCHVAFSCRRRNTRIVTSRTIN